jgi:hypothetical protein
MKESTMTTKVIIIALAFSVLGGALAVAQSLKPQTTHSTTVHAMNLDRCPYYPSPVFCHSRTGEPDQLAHDADGH